VEGTIRRTETSASPDVVFSVAADLAAYPTWATGVNEVEILEEEDSGRARRARFEIEGFIKRITYELEYTYEPPHRMSWRAVPGADIREMEGSYTFKALDGGGTEIVYALRVEPAFTVPGFLRRQAEKQIVESALRQLRRFAEQLESGDG
jgi:uncharacterized membrane protein